MCGRAETTVRQREKVKKEKREREREEKTGFLCIEALKEWKMKPGRELICPLFSSLFVWVT